MYIGYWPVKDITSQFYSLVSIILAALVNKQCRQSMEAFAEIEKQQQLSREHLTWTAPFIFCDAFLIYS